MSNSKKVGMITPELIALVVAVLAEANAHTYSVSRVYEAYNQATGKEDRPETCPSCLIARVKELKKWYADLPAKSKVKDLEVGPENEDEVTTTYEDLVAKFQINTEDAAQEVEGVEKLLLSEDADLSESDVNLLKERGDAIHTENLQYDDPGAPFFSAPAKGVTRHPVGDGLPFDFAPGKDDVNKGTIAMADGSKVKAGTHTTADGTTFVVQANGNARINAEDLT